MTHRFNIKHFWLVVGLLFLVECSALWAYRSCSRTLPESQCSEVYRRYAHVPGVEADVTLLRAADSAGWDFLVDTFHVSKERLNLVKSMPELRVFERQGLRNHPEILAITKGENRDLHLTKDDVELCFFDLQEKEICIFHTQSAKEVDAVRGYNYENMMSNKRINLK